MSDARSELIVQLVQGSLLFYQGRLEDCERESRHSADLARQLGARRFQAEALSLVAATLIARGQSRAAYELISEALELVRSSGMNYCGPTLLAIYARTAENETDRAQALRQAESLLAAGCVSHTYFEFYFNAIELSLNEQRWSKAESYADALAEYTRDESVPWTDLLIERGRLLAKIGAGDHSSITLDQLRKLRATTHARGVGLALPAMDAVLQRFE